MDRPTASNVRIACVAIAAYDFFITLPAEWRIYRVPRGRYFVRISALLFFLVRYLSVILLTIGSYLFWRGPELSDETCGRLFPLPSIFKCLQAMVVQLIMGWRTYNISRQRKHVLYFLTCLYIVVTVIQWFAHFYKAAMSRQGGGCSMVGEGHVQWAFYLCCVLWDAATLFISLFYLSRIRTTSPLLTKLTRTMRVDGLVYFVAMTAINALNMGIFLKATQVVIQGSVIIAYTAAWILSQRILINLNDSASGNRDSITSRTRTVTISVSNSAEELDMEAGSRTRAAAEESDLGTRNPGQRFHQRVHGTVQSSSGEFLDSVIEIDIGARSPVKSPSDDANQSGPSRERYDRGDEDSLFDLTTDSGIDTNHNSFPRRNEGPLMTTRRF